MGAMVYLFTASGPALPIEAVQPGSLEVFVENLHERPSNLYCSCNNIDGEDLVFDLVVGNRGSQARTLHAFVWASNDDVSPPERALWPVSAVVSALDERGELRISDPAAGVRLDLPAGRTQRFGDCSVLQPIGWYAGSRVRFKLLRVQLWDEDGSLALSRDFPAEFGAQTDIGVKDRP
jgi:hypothetical protein